EEFPGFAVELVCSALDRRVDDGAGRSAIFGGIIVGFNFELGKCIRVWLNNLVGETLIAGAVGVVVDAIEQEVVEFAAAAVDVIRSVATAVGAILQRGFRYTRSQQREVGVGATIQRQLYDLLGVNELAARAGLCLN